jgi:putative NADH-flavin reductase
MKAALIGASGKVGRRLAAELIQRGHEVVGLARRPAETGTSPLRLVDATDAAALAEALAGCEAVFHAANFRSSDPAAVLRAMKIAGVGRLLVVGGAGSLYVSPGPQFIDSPDFPEAFRPEVAAGRAFLHVLQDSDADWTFLSPALVFAPGERTGAYRLGGDDLMRDAKGESRISYEDLAKALVDELETPQHTRRRFSIAY